MTRPDRALEGTEPGITLGYGESISAGVAKVEWQNVTGQRLTLHAPDCAEPIQLRAGGAMQIATRELLRDPQLRSWLREQEGKGLLRRL